jgi:hypothetical protein
MYTVLVKKCPALVNRNRVLLQQDNARPHTAKKTLQKMEELEGIELLPHPAFSPDLEPSDYYLFRSMAQLLHGKKFQSVADVEIAAEEFLLPKIKSGFTRHSRNWLKNGRRPLNMRACILNIEFLLFCMFWPIKVFISNPPLFLGHPQYLSFFHCYDLWYNFLGQFSP